MAKDKSLRDSPYARILRNAEKGIGVRLSALEVANLARDQAIRWRGELDLEGVMSEDDP